MWKVLLCEDEPVVREALVEQIPWEQSGFALVAQADNGTDALELIRRLQPDLVITDIVMPGLDGIELLQQARAFSDARFVMLTCMNEFEYVRLALEHGASGYLLKLSADEKALGEMLHKLDKELKEQSIQKGGQEPFRFQQEYKELWEQLLAGGDAKPRGTASGAAGQQAAAGYLRRFHELYPLAEVRVLLPSCREEPERLEEKWRQSLPPRCLLHRVDLSGVKTFFLWMASPEPTLTYGRGQGESDAGVFIPRTEVVRRGESSYPGLLELWRSALLEINRRWYGGEEAQEEKRPPSEWRLSWTKEKRWIRCLEARDREGLTRLAEEIWQEMQEAPAWFFQAVQAAERLLGLAHHVWEKSASPTEEASHLNTGASVPLNAGNHEALKERLEAELDRLLGQLHQSERPETGREEINRVIEYVQLHLKEDISLRAMAHYVNLDERYLSTLFSRQTGETFINFLQQARVARAKSLLAETDLPIREIGEQAGFANENYFFRVFKRWTGETPAQFRRHKL